MEKTSKQIKETLIKFSNVRGLSGHESEVMSLIKKELDGCDFEYESDNLGSLAVIKRSKNKDARSVGFFAHADEVGFIITRIDDNGFIYFNSFGRYWGHVLLGKTLDIKRRDGSIVKGVVGSTPPHILKESDRNNVIPVEEMYIDVGASSKKEVLSFGIKLGDTVTPTYKAWEMLNGDFVCGKAMDNRSSVATCVELMKSIANVDLDVDVYFIATVQEEVGLRGAVTSANKWKPDVGFAIDVTVSNDQPNVKKNDTKLGNGVALSMFDNSTIGNYKLRHQLEDLAEKNSIKYTLDGLPFGGTDSGSIHKTGSGIYNMTISIPCRYFHSHSAIVSISDLENTKNLLEKYLVNFSEEFFKKLRK